MNKLEGRLKPLPEIGGWGGSCTCPNGESYRVGDYNNFCKSMACHGGKPGLCEKMHRDERVGIKVTCDVPNSHDMEHSGESRE